MAGRVPGEGMRPHPRTDRRAEGSPREAVECWRYSGGLRRCRRSPRYAASARPRPACTEGAGTGSGPRPVAGVDYVSPAAGSIDYFFGFFRGARFRSARPADAFDAVVAFSAASAAAVGPSPARPFSSAAATSSTYW